MSRADEAYKAGIEYHIIDGASVRIYNPEKTLADFLKFRNKIGMNYKELLERHNALLEQVNKLRKENVQLRAQLGLPKSDLVQNTTSVKNTARSNPDDELAERNCFSGVDCTPDSLSKIRLFISLFKGREDVYAKRWENKNKGTSGYAPVCLNQWRPGICGKPKMSCSTCKDTSYAELNETVIENHLRGQAVVGIYPMLSDETCCFLVMDFDKAEWEKDISVVRDVCHEFVVPIEDARARFENEGPNELPTQKKRSLLTVGLEVAREPMFLMLVAAGSLYLLMGEPADALMLLAFVFVVMAITIIQERRTERALEALRDLSSPRALVIRDGLHRRIAGREVVRGDLVVLGEGDRVPADGLLRRGINLVVVVFAVTRGGGVHVWKQGLLDGIAMAMATLPEEFPVVLTVFLALGAWRISRSQVLTRRMPAVETLGAATVLCVDKTGLCSWS
jgi:hypothetical protein